MVIHYATVEERHVICYESLSDMSSLHWCVIGDFNDRPYQEDKKKKNGVHPHPNWLFIRFRQHGLDNNRRCHKLNEKHAKLLIQEESFKKAMRKGTLA